MMRVDCIGMVGKLPFGMKTYTFWDTGRYVSPMQLAELMALQHSAFQVSDRKDRRQVERQIITKITEVIQQVNVYPIGKAALADDGRILVTDPWFEAREIQ